MQNPITVFIIDDHQMLIDGIKALLLNENDFKIVGDALRSLEAIDRIKKMDVDVIITDINMPEMNGLQLANAIRRIKPEQKILALSMYGDKAVITDMIDAGVKGYVLKNRMSVILPVNFCNS